MNELEEFDSEEVAKKASSELLPEKSRKVYEKQYEAFVKWCKDKGVKQYTENVLLTYFEETSRVVAAPTLGARYSMLKAMLLVKNEADLSKFTKLLSFLKKINHGYERKMSGTLTAEQVVQFLAEAPDAQFLMAKVALILGIAGACRRTELLELSIDDYTDLGSSLLFNVKNSKTKHERSFLVKNSEGNLVDFVELCRKYIALRKTGTIKHSRFFSRYKYGKCTSLPAGKNVFATLPEKIATFLKLPNASSYTGHCFRDTSASLLAGSAASADVLRRLGGLKSSTVVEGLVENSINIKNNVADNMFGHEEEMDVDNCTSSDTTNRSSNSKNSQQSLLTEELQSSSDSLDLTEHEFALATPLTALPRIATQTVATSEEPDVGQFINLCAKFLPQSLMQFVKEQAHLNKKKTEDSRVRGQKRKSDGPEQPTCHLNKTCCVKDIAHNGAENCKKLPTDEISIMEPDLIQLQNVLDDCNFEEDLNVKEEIFIKIKSEPVDENDSPTLEDPLAITTTPNFLTENHYKEKDSQTPTHCNQKKTNVTKLTKSVFNQLLRRPSVVILPSPAWACHLIPSSTKNVICFAKIDLANEKPIVEKRIVLNEESVQVFVANKRVQDSVSDASSITSVVEFENFVRTVDSLGEVGGGVVVCGGA